MTIFIWNDARHVTENYHDGGGVVVIAESLDSAKKIIESVCAKGCTALKDKPDFQASVEADKENSFVFPDAGCC